MSVVGIFTPPSTRGPLHPDAAGARQGINIAISNFGYKLSIAMCGCYGFIRSGKSPTPHASTVGSYATFTRNPTASDVWADTGYRSQANEAWLKSMDRFSRVHRRRPRGMVMPRRGSGTNAKRSIVRARVEHVVARKKDQMGLFVRTIGMARAQAKITLANPVYIIARLIFPERQATRGQPRPAKMISGRVNLNPVS